MSHTSISAFPQKAIWRILIFKLVIFIFIVAVNNAYAGTTPRYMRAVTQEIARLGFAPDCDDSNGTCTIITDQAEGVVQPTPQSKYRILISVDDPSATIRFVISGFIPSVKVTDTLARKLMYINNRLMVATLSLDEKTDNIVLSAVVNTDSNFDRKTFRSVLKGFIQVAIDVDKELGTLRQEMADSEE